MNQDFIKEIIAKRIPCVFVSPHLDDALLSCAALIKTLNAKTEITVINVFTKAHSGPYTTSAKLFIKTSGERDAQKLTEERELEDKNAFSTFRVKQINLGLQDAIFRQKSKKSFLGNYFAEFDHVYPTYRWHILNAISQSDPALKQLRKKLKPYITNKTLVFAPFGIGSHVDHRIVRTVSHDLTHRLILYSDFPYNIRENYYGDPPRGSTVSVINPTAEKNKIITKYRSQINGLFPGGKIPLHKEVFFVPENFK